MPARRAVRAPGQPAPILDPDAAPPPPPAPPPRRSDAETLACNACLVALATLLAEHSRVALMLRANGATEALQVAARRLAAPRHGLSGDAGGDGLSALSYDGAPPERRFGDAARRALERLDAATAVLAALHAEAAEEERPCERRAFRSWWCSRAPASTRGAARRSRRPSRELCGAASDLWRRPVVSSFMNCFN